MGAGLIESVEGRRGKVDHPAATQVEKQTRTELVKIENRLTKIRERETRRRR
jgi:hypothetical protein